MPRRSPRAHEGDTLAGAMRFGGVNVKRPAGLPDLPLRFSFMRTVPADRSVSPTPCTSGDPA